MKSQIKQIVNYFVKPIQWIILYTFDLYFKFVTNKKQTFVIGVDEIANSTYFLKKILGPSAVSVNFRRNKYYKNNQYDYNFKTSNNVIIYVLKIFYGPYLLAKLSNQSDVFIYFWWTGFCQDREMDYKFLKFKNKKIICIFLGTDIRSHKLRIEYHDKHALDTSSNYQLENLDFRESENRVKRVAKLADKYANLIFSHPKDQISYLKRPVVRNSYRLSDEYFTCNKKKFLDLDFIKIVHAPSSPIPKGTQLVRAAIKKLTLEGYSIEYIELINKPNGEVLNALERSHIVLNQFYAFAPGVFGIEAMAKCNAVLMSADYEGMPDGAENAWIMTKYWEVYDKLKYLLDNPSLLQKYAESGYEFVKNNYTEEKVREFYLKIFYEHKIIDDKSIS